MVIVPATILLLILKRKKKMKTPTADEIKADFQKIAEIYGREHAQNLERLVRWETAHFKSKGFKLTHAAGMEAVNKKFPYGWGSLATFWSLNPQFKPKGTHFMIDSGKRKVYFIVFPNFYAFLRSIAKFLELNNWEMGEWFSNDREAQIAYWNKVKKVSSTLV